MKLKNILKKGLLIFSLYLTFTLYLFIAADRIERLDKITQKTSPTQTSFTIKDSQSR